MNVCVGVGMSVGVIGWVIGGDEDLIILLYRRKLVICMRIS